MVPGPLGQLHTPVNGEAGDVLCGEHLPGAQLTVHLRQQQSISTSTSVHLGNNNDFHAISGNLENKCPKAFIRESLHVLSNCKCIAYTLHNMCTTGYKVIPVLTTFQA